MNELRPLLGLLSDDVSITFDEKRHLPHKIVRKGQEEDVERLSGGMREQLSVLTRLAFARLLAKDGRPAPVILDDALVYSDDDRIEKMFDALHRQAHAQQIIVFSCRQRAFQKLGGNVLHMSDWKPDEWPGGSLNRPIKDNRLGRLNRAPLVLEAGDFVLVPEVFDFTMSSINPPASGAPNLPLETGPGTFHLGEHDALIDVRCLVGHCSFASPNRELLISLLPAMIHVRAQGRLIALVEMIQEETQSDRPARDMVLRRLLDLLLVEALRSIENTMAEPGLLRGLAYPQIALALRQIHADPGAGLSVQGLAAAAGMSRSTFFDRFRGQVGAVFMEYVVVSWMAVVKDMLVRGNIVMADLARRIGYGSVSSFSMAFSRHVGTPPGAFAARSRATQGTPHPVSSR